MVCVNTYKQYKVVNKNLEAPILFGVIYNNVMQLF